MKKWLGHPLKMSVVGVSLTVLACYKFIFKQAEPNIRFTSQGFKDMKTNYIFPTRLETLKKL